MLLDWWTKIINVTLAVLLSAIGNIYPTAQFPLSRVLQNVILSYIIQILCDAYFFNHAIAHPSHAILLTHIPLSRTETADCGPLREKGGIRKGAGPGYQSMLGKQTTSFLLKTLEPLVVFR